MKTAWTCHRIPSITCSCKKKLSLVSSNIQVVWHIFTRHGSILIMNWPSDCILTEQKVFLSIHCQWYVYPYTTRVLILAQSVESTHRDVLWKFASLWDAKGMPISHGIFWFLKLNEVSQSWNDYLDKKWYITLKNINHQDNHRVGPQRSALPEFKPPPFAYFSSGLFFSIAVNANLHFKNFYPNGLLSQRDFNVFSIPCLAGIPLR